MKLLELSRNETGIIINALMEFRNNRINNKEDIDIEPINELLIKIIDTPEKKSFFRNSYER